MRKLGTVQCLEVPVSNPHDEAHADVVILFHGFGADAYDLRSLSDAFHPKRPTHWLFPQGLIEVPIGPGWTGRAWWKIDMAALERARQTGEIRNLVDNEPEGLPHARTKVFEMIEKLGVPWDRIILGGFSQGAMLATDLFLRAPVAPKGLLLMSGTLVHKPEWKELAKKRAGSRFFICHGTADAVLPHKGAAQLETLLIAGGMKGSLLTFTGGHEIPQIAVEKANEYLNSLA